MRWVAFALGLTMAVNLAACSGGGSHASPLPVTPGGASPATTGTAKFTLLVPNPAPAGSAKRRAFISPSANGALATTYAHTDTNHTTPLGSVATDISASSSACTTVATGRNCVITVQAPAGNDDFVFVLYDAAPVNGAIPSTAHVLGIAGATQTIAGGTVNTIFASVGGVIAGFGGSTTNVNEAADGRPKTVALVIAPTDFGNNAITAGTTNALYANPITATVSDGSVSHTLLTLNGGAPASSVTITKATDTVQAVYDGGGSSGYVATVALAATAVGGQGGATQENLTITAALFVSNPTVFYSPSPAQLNTYPQGQHVLMISEPSAASGTTYTATPTGCSNILSVGTIVGTGIKATLLVVGGVQASTSGCSVAISDGTLTFTVAVTNTIRAGPSGTPAIREYTTTADTPEGVVTGADGNIWFVQKGAAGGGVGSINAIATAAKPNGSAATMVFGPQTVGGFIEPYRIALGPDGNVWWGDCSQASVAKITTTGSVSTFNVSYAGTQGVTAGLDGNVWFDEYCASKFTASTDGIVGNINTTTGSLSEVAVPNANSPGLILMENVALGPDGNIWYDDFNDSVVGHIQSGVATNFTTHAFSVASPMTAGSDGNMWVGSTVGPGIISIYSTAGVLLTSVDTTALYPGANQVFMTAGPDGAIWYTDDSNNAIGRMTTTHSYVEYPVPSGGTPSGITVGPDGNIWFMEVDSDNIGVVIL
ncbi:MAG TPA: hypothetical protein VMB20_01200 [Candidatus Acidoferrum sp.]|nr:hypothetical protein [Candidatus Acidoferrum sp.]